MRETLFAIGCQNKRTGERVKLYVWAQDVESATHSFSDLLFRIDGMYIWTGSEPTYDEKGKLIQREV